MTDFNFIETELLAKAFIYENEICWSLRNIQNGIKELSQKERKIDSITIYFRVGEKVYCPIWGDCVMLDGDNSNYLRLFENLDTKKQITFDVILELIKRFGIIIPADYNYTVDEKKIKESVKIELANYDFNHLYFALSIED